MDRDVPAIFPQELAARATWRGGDGSIGNNRDPREFPHAFAQGFPQGHALCTNGQSIGNVFDVASSVDAAILCFQCSADFESGISSDGVLASSRCPGDEVRTHTFRKSAA